MKQFLIVLIFIILLLITIGLTAYLVNENVLNPILNALQTRVELQV